MFKYSLDITRPSKPSAVKEYPILLSYRVDLHALLSFLVRAACLDHLMLLDFITHVIKYPLKGS